MKVWTLFKLWLVVCVLAFGLFILVETLLVFVNVNEQYSRDLSATGLSFFELSTVIGSSLFFASLFWLLLSKLLVRDFEDKILRLLLEAFQLWLVILFFIVCLVLTDTMFLILVRDYSFFVTFGLIDIIRVFWIDLLIVFLFYTFLGFQAIRKTWQYDSFTRRLVIDFSQVLLISLELAFLSLPTGWVTQVNGSALSFLFYFLYLSFCLCFVIESFWWFNQRIEARRERSGRDYSADIFMLQVIGVFGPLFLLLVVIPVPFNLFFQNPLVFLFGLTICFILVLSGVLFFDLLAVVGVSKRVLQVIDVSTLSFRYQISTVLASRGAIFNYPPPIGILSGVERGSPPINSRQRKVTLKIACGHCYHVFEVETVVKGSNLRSFPCPFCKSLATTPVWE